MSALKDLKGMTFGELTVIERAKNNKNGKARWLCLCSCENKKIISSANLLSGHTMSCGCMRGKCKAGNFRKSYKKRVGNRNGLSNHRLYGIWRNMKMRCNLKSCENYHYYGGRGIKVCDEWTNDFMNFYNWAMANGYTEKLTLDRKNNDGNYEPNNCRWVTQSVQNMNKRGFKARTITINGITKHLFEWAKETGICDETIRKRYKSGLRGLDLIKKPVKMPKRNKLGQFFKD